MPREVAARIKEAGGLWAALLSVLPCLEAAGRVVRASTSSGISRTDTGERLPGSVGVHVYLHVTDGTDEERFLKTLHDRCWLAGFGWHMVGAGGQLLERSIVDRMAGAPERLVFEGAPVLDRSLKQDPVARQPVVNDGSPLDMREVCRPLSLSECAALKQLGEASAHALAPKCSGVTRASTRL
jgi:hypothetical protein